MNSLTQFKKISILPFLIALMLVALAQNTQAVSPPPDGGYPGANTAEGQNALFNLTTGANNTALGFDALWHNTAGSSNTAIGREALFSNTGRGGHTAIGDQALYSNTTGIGNTATGDAALYSNTTGDGNTATGSAALVSNATGINNTADGFNALFSNTTGSQNTASGFLALASNTTGSQNTANGFQALYGNTTGYSNTANGFGALGRGNVTGAHNIALGFQAGYFLTTGDYNIDIGNEGVDGESRTIRIGDIQTRAFIAGIYGVNEGGAPAAVYINSNGRLGTQAPSSSRRFKKEIKAMDKTSEAILSLNPVTFHYKSDNTDTPQFGLIAEEVADVNPALVVRDEKGEIYTVRYDAVNAMLLNEFLKEHHTVQELKSVVAKQEAAAAQQQKQIEALTAGLQKVSAQLEASKPAPANGQQSLKPVGVGATSQRLILTGERSSLLMHTATTERDSSSPPTKN